MASSSKNSYSRSWFKKKTARVNPKLVDQAQNFDICPKFGYAGYKIYFPEDRDLDPPDTLKRVQSFENFIGRNQSNYVLSTIELNKCFSVDYKSIVSDNELGNGWPVFKREILESTEYCLNCMGLAMYDTILKKSVKNSSDSENPPKEPLNAILARIINYEPILQLKDLGVNYYGKLVSVRGTVIKAESVKIVCEYMAFSCSTCTGVQVVKQLDGIFTFPKSCPTRECKSRKFNPDHSSLFTRTTGSQSIKIQELIGTQCENGRIPRTLECELTEDLVNSCVPGDDITIAGVLKIQNPDSGDKNKQNTVFSLHLNVVSVINNKSESQGSYGASERITFNQKDYYAIQKIHAEPQLFRFLVQSLCPHIYGHEMVKAGLLLGLFGGTKSERTRAESHILMVGDPGLGKSQMLQACTSVAPRGVYVCGNTSTSSGLTVTMTRESGGDSSLEAGALMLADQGCCCIDEFDKMPSQHACLLEAMEQQSISIAKAGVVCTLPTRATILAAANPSGGHYSKAKTVAENLKISSPMLSRFDLIFILLDQHNEELDMLMSEHVLAVHRGRKSENSLLNASSSKVVSSGLRGRLKSQPGEAIDHLPHVLFRKYIAYAQKYVNPQLSQEAMAVLKDFYLKLRKQFQTGDCTPVTTRQLNSLIRLTQARAKVELREEATEADALDVADIMKHSLVDIFTDDVGIMDTTRSQNGTGMSNKNQVIKLLRILQQKSEAQGKSLFTTKEIRELSENVGICRNKFYTVLENLNLQGFILSKGGNNYQLVTADF